MALYDALRDLPLTIERYHLEPHRIEVSPIFTRRTTSVCLVGTGSDAPVGRGEDVNYGTDEQELFQTTGGRHALAGDWTLDTFSRHLDTLELFDAEPSQAAYRDYRRWAFESAALDLALQQAGKSLADALGRTAAPLTFVASIGLGSPPSFAPIETLLAADPTLRFKLDAANSWDAVLIDRLAATGAVTTVDLKGAYKGTIVDQPPDARLYRDVVARFPDAWIEDPGRSAETDPILGPHWERITWDAPIHSVADVLALDHAPRTLNVKPSRFGPLHRLFEFYDHCTEQGIALYGGGQFELAEGRRHIQLLASLFHPDAPNDVAPIEYHHALSGHPLPTSPLEPAAFGAEGVGFARTT